jgi:uncharacterized protein with von Willebrand factor type A (vWA) domain
MSRGADEWLASLPGGLFAKVVTHPLGDLEPRARAIAGWRAALLEGRLPAADLAWPGPEIDPGLRDWFTRHEFARLCEGSEAITDEILRDMLDALEETEAAVSEAVERWMLELRRELGERDPQPDDDLEIERRIVAARTAILALGSAENAEGDDAETGLVVEVAWLTASIRVEIVRRRTQGLAAGLDARWAERLDAWKAIRETFGPLAGRLAAGWDLSASIFRATAWRELAKYREIARRLPAIEDIVRSLGRLQDSQDDDPRSLSAASDLFESIARAEDEFREVEHPLARSKAKGIEFSGDFARMIPSEAMLRLRPRLRSLWHARRMEQGLLAYRVRGTYLDRTTRRFEEDRPLARSRERGPILICIDTSGSMQGGPDLVAKALVLEALRIAHAERRACRLYAFGGPNECAETELELSPHGLEKLLDFLSKEFGGGTDIDAPFRAAIARLGRDEWSRADLLLVSDGDFGRPAPGLQHAIDDAKTRLGLRIAGLIVGRSENPSMKELCSPLRRIESWKV